MEKYSFFDHLEELRKRIIVSAATLFIISVATFYLVTPKAIKILAKYLIKGRLIAISPQETFLVYIKLSFILGIILSSPILLYQIWAFIAPGLFPKEKRLILPVVILSFLFFIIGALFGYFCILPFTLRFLLGFSLGDIEPMLSVARYVSFCSWLLLAFGVVFQTPLIILLLVKIGIVEPESLIKNRKYTLVGIFIIAAVMTPTPDVANQILVAIPILLLYEMSIFLSRFIVKKKKT